MNVLVLAELFPPDMGGGSTRAYNVVKGLVSLGHKVTVVTAFPHYPMGNIPKKYKRRLLNVESFGKARVFRVWVPPLVSRGLARRLVLFLCFCFSFFQKRNLLHHFHRFLPENSLQNICWAANRHKLMKPSDLYQYVIMFPASYNPENT